MAFEEQIWPLFTFSKPLAMNLLSFFTAAFILVCSLAATEPTTDVAQPASEKTEEAARKVVERYYAELNLGHYEVAYRLWRGGSPNGKSLQDFTAGFADTAHASVETDAPTDGEGAAGSLYVTIPVKVTATLKDGTRQHYVGKYVMHRCNDVDGSTLEERRWHINSASLHAAP
jgi:hypothetical protein